MRVLAVGDVVGKPGIEALAALLPRVRREEQVDFVVVNSENAASNGMGLGARNARRILSLGVDVITLGDHWGKKADVFPLLAEEGSRILRPANVSPLAAGRGAGIFPCGDQQIGVVCLQGRIFMDPADCPFQAATRELERLGGCHAVLVEIHAEATSEKIAMGLHLDGKVAAVWGTHTHVQTADERVLPGGTACLSDLGMTGPHQGIIGRQAEPVLHRFRTGMPAPFHVAEGDLRLSGAVIEVLPTGRAAFIRRVQACLGR